MTSKTQATKGNIDKSDYIKLTRFVPRRTPSREWKDNPCYGRKYFKIEFEKIKKKIIFDKELHRVQLNNKKINNPS